MDNRLLNLDVGRADLPGVALDEGGEACVIAWADGRPLGAERIDASGGRISSQRLQTPASKYRPAALGGFWLHLLRA